MKSTIGLVLCSLSSERLCAFTHGPQSSTRTPHALVEVYVKESPEWRSLHPMERVLRFVPESCFSEKCTFVQTNLQVSSNILYDRKRDTRFSLLVDFQKKYESFFFDGPSVALDSTICRVSSISLDSVVVQWNVTWIPPTVASLHQLASRWPGLQVCYVTYNHLSDQVSVFSWKNVGKLFRDAFQMGQMCIPLACIQGQTQLDFVRENSGGGWKLRRLSEDLQYARDLTRGSLQNRRCAADLRLFLEDGRRPPSNSWQEWEDVVCRALPWAMVPGSGSLDIEPPQHGESKITFIFGGLVSVTMLLFAGIIGPILLG